MYCVVSVATRCTCNIALVPRLLSHISSASREAFGATVSSPRSACAPTGCSRSTPHCNAVAQRVANGSPMRCNRSAQRCNAAQPLEARGPQTHTRTHACTAHARRLRALAHTCTHSLTHSDTHVLMTPGAYSAHDCVDLRISRTAGDGLADGVAVVAAVLASTVRYTHSERTEREPKAQACHCYTATCHRCTATCAVN